MFSVEFHFAKMENFGHIAKFLISCWTLSVGRIIFPPLKKDFTSPSETGTFSRHNSSFVAGSIIYNKTYYIFKLLICHITISLHFLTFPPPSIFKAQSSKHLLVLCHLHLLNIASPCQAHRSHHHHHCLHCCQ